MIGKRKYQSSGGLWWETWLLGGGGDEMVGCVICMICVYYCLKVSSRLIMRFHAKLSSRISDEHLNGASGSRD